MGKMANCDLMKGDHKTPEYLKMNPQHTIPTMKDGDFCMNESRPIATYLASKYGKDDKLYPKDVTTRAIVDQRLYFDMGVFYKAFGDNVYPIMFGGPTPGQDKMDRFKEVMGWVEKMKGEIPNYEKANGEGAAGFGGWFKAAKEK